MRSLAITVVLALGFVTVSVQSDQRMEAIEHLLADPEVASDRVLHNAFIDLKELALMTNSDSCDRVAANYIESLINNDIPHTYDKLFVFQQLVQHYMVEHAKACNDVYPTVIAQRKEKLGELNLKNFQTLAAKFIPEEINGSCSLGDPMIDAAFVHWLSYYDYLVEAAKDDSRYSAITEKRNGSADLDGLRYLFEVYVHDTCKAVHDQMDDLVEVTKYDLRASGFGNSEDKCAAYANDVFVMTLCTKVATDKEYRESALDKLARDVTKVL